VGMRVRFAKAMDWGGGQYGEAVLSRLPTVSARRTPLPHRAETGP